MKGGRHGEERKIHHKEGTRPRAFRRNFGTFDKAGKRSDHRIFLRDFIPQKMEKAGITPTFDRREWIGTAQAPVSESRGQC